MLCYLSLRDPLTPRCPIEREAPHDHKPCGAALILTSSHLYVRHSKRTFERLSTAEKAFLITAGVALLAPRIAATHSEPLTLTDRPVMPAKCRERHPRTFSGYQRLRLDRTALLNPPVALYARIWRCVHSLPLGLR
jgi:hypothetical protein